MSENTRGVADATVPEVALERRPDELFFTESQDASGSRAFPCEQYVPRVSGGGMQLVLSACGYRVSSSPSCPAVTSGGCLARGAQEHVDFLGYDVKFMFP